MRQFDMGIPSYKTKLRMYEVHFYLIITQFKKSKRDEIYLEVVLENLSMMYGIKPTTIMFAIEQLFTLMGKPTTLEYALLQKYLGIPMRKMMKIINKSSRTTYDALEKYIHNEAYELNPKLSEEHVQEIKKFNDLFSDTFELLGELSRKGNLYD